MIKIHFDSDHTMAELVEAARKEWAKANIEPKESYCHFAQRIGVSYRTVLRWLGRLSSTDRIVRKALRGHKPKPFEMSILPIPRRWNQEDIRVYSGPLVYVVLKEDAPVYVGSSVNGAKRILALKAHSHGDVLLNASSVLFYPCPNRGEAKRLESQLIRQYQPLFNINQT